MEIDAQLAKVAQKKLRGDKPLASREIDALRRVKKTERERLYCAIPIADYQRLSRRQLYQLRNAERDHGVRCGGKTIDLGQVLPSFHDILEGKGAPATTATTTRDVGEFMATMNGDSSALDISKAVVRMVSRQLAARVKEGKATLQDVDSVKKSLQELRLAEADYIELETKRRQLIERDEVLSLIGLIAGRVVRCLCNLENTLAEEVAVWMANPDVLAMDANARNTLFRGFIIKACREARQVEADGAMKVLDGSLDEES